MKKSILNLGKSLNKAEQKTINGGKAGCKIAVRNSDGSFRHWSAQVYSVETAQSAYSSGQVYNDGSYASGYCCASC